MLVLSRKIGQKIVIGNGICITVLGFQGQNVRIGVSALKEVVVDRQEIHKKRNELVPQPPVRAIGTLG
jgi:carbon storage regulator